MSIRLLTKAEKAAVLNVLAQRTDELASRAITVPELEEYELLHDAQEILRQQETL